MRERKKALEDVRETCEEETDHWRKPTDMIKKGIEKELEDIAEQKPDQFRRMCMPRRSRS